MSFRSAEVLAQASDEVNVDMSNIYSRPLGTPPGSSLNVSAAPFVPRSSSAFSIASLPAPVTRTSGAWGPFNRYVDGQINCRKKIAKDYIIVNFSHHMYI